MLTNEQRVTLKDQLPALVEAAKTAEVKIGLLDADVAYAKRTDTQIAKWLNEPNTDRLVAYRRNVSGRELLQLTNITLLSKLADPFKLQLWTLMIENAPLDFTEQWVRDHTSAIWGGDADALFAQLMEPVTRAEVLLATSVDGQVVTRAFTGQLSLVELSESLNGKLARE